MASFLTFVSLLLIMLSRTSAQGGTGNCCLKTYNTAVQRDLLKTYYNQSRLSCPIQAVVFITVKNRTICSNPKKRWTQTSMAYLDGKNSHSLQTKPHATTATGTISHPHTLWRLIQS
ncbi:monocyte chemotactic protein 1B-like [Genypterus blacodes]|uniref:monocyte chemotactic protein 1B-like n=1 Tax=Genypterus blacodes TaxID=154954 RepID=UPI003F76B091